MDKRYHIVDREGRLWAKALLRRQAREIAAMLQAKQPSNKFYIKEVVL